MKTTLIQMPGRIIRSLIPLNSKAKEMNQMRKPSWPMMAVFFALSCGAAQASLVKLHDFSMAPQMALAQMTIQPWSMTAHVSMARHNQLHQ